MELHHNVAVLGTIQSGKSTSAMRLLQKQPGVKLFINTKREDKWFDPLKIGCVKYQVYNKDDLLIIYDHFTRFSDGIIQFVPSATSKTSLPELEDLFQIILEYHQSNPTHRTTILFDEIQVFQSVHGVNDAINRMWTMGHGLGIRCICIAQRPQFINYNLLSCTDLFIIHAVDISDLKYLAEKGALKLDLENPPIFPPCKIKPYIPHTSYIQMNKLIGLKELEGEWTI